MDSQEQCTPVCDKCHGFVTFNAWHLPVPCPKCGEDHRDKMGCQCCKRTGKVDGKDCPACDGGRLFD
jgi:hypothetical protein